MHKLIDQIREEVKLHIQAGNPLSFSNSCADSIWTVSAKPGKKEPIVKVDGYAADHYDATTIPYNTLRTSDILMLLASAVEANAGY